jgi:cytochrome c
MEFNKALAAVLLAGIIGMVSGIVADALIVPADVHAAYKIDTSGVSAPPSATPADTSVPPISPLLASADPVAGQSVARACQGCHSFDKGGANKTGPDNWDIVGAPMAHKEDFNYSAAMQAKHDEGAHWGYEELNQFLANPKAYIPGTIMGFNGVKKEQDRANLIAWLRTLSDNPQPLPDPNAAPAADASAPAEGATPAPAEGAAPAEPAAPATTGG